MSNRPLLPKRLHFTAHAAQRMAERHFSVEDVKRILYLGTVDKSSTQVPGLPFRHARRFAFGNRIAKVIFTEEPDQYLIITVEWVDR